MCIVLVNCAVWAYWEAGCESRVILSFQIPNCLSHNVLQGPLSGGGMAATSSPKNETEREDPAQEWKHCVLEDS